MRFSLKAFFAVVTAIVLFLGYARYRRQLFLSVRDEVKSEWGASIIVPSSYVDYLWQRRPSAASITFDAHVGSDGEASIYTTRYSAMNMKELHRHLQSIGIEHVDYLGEVRLNPYGVPVGKPEVLPLGDRSVNDIRRYWTP
jgi:hypothetical protein